MTDRNRAIEEFLAAAGWAGAERRLLAADASFRRYERVSRGRDSLVLMNAQPPQESVRAFDLMARHLRALGLSAPGPIRVDETLGLMLLEDFGDRTFTRVLAEGMAEAPLYRLAIDVLIALHRRWAPEADGAAADGAALGAAPGPSPALAPYDEDLLLEEATLLIDWTLPALRGAPLPETHRRAYRQAWRTVLPGARMAPESLVLRDYHVDNLILLQGREGIAACGLLDFQDAVVGPVSYDVVSLLEDARRDVSPGVVEESLSRYLAAFPNLDREMFLTSYAILGAQRAAKVIGIFTRLSWRDGKHQYLRHIPRVWRLLGAGLAHPALAPVAAWFAREVPAAERVRPRPGDSPGDSA